MSMNRGLFSRERPQQPEPVDPEIQLRDAQWRPVNQMFAAMRPALAKAKADLQIARDRAAASRKAYAVAADALRTLRQRENGMDPELAVALAERRAIRAAIVLDGKTGLEQAEAAAVLKVDRLEDARLFLKIDRITEAEREANRLVHPMGVDDQLVLVLEERIEYLQGLIDADLDPRSLGFYLYLAGVEGKDPLPSKQREEAVA